MFITREYFNVKATISFSILLSFTALSCGIFQSEQKVNEQTISTIRQIGTAIEAYAAANNGKYPVNQGGEISALKPLLVPKFIANLSGRDGSGHPIKYYCFHETGPYYIIALGEDHKEDLEIYHSPGKPTDTSFVVTGDPTEDIIFSQARFVRYPKGLKSTGIKESDD